MFLLFAIYGTRICLADKSSSSISASKSEVKQNNDALVIVLCVSVAHMVFYNQSPIVWMVNTTFGFLLSPASEASLLVHIRMILAMDGLQNYLISLLMFLIIIVILDYFKKASACSLSTLSEQ